MKHFIDKSALVAEIEKRINEEIQSWATNLGYSQGCVDSMRNVLSFLNTLEVKEEEHWQEVRERAAIAAMQGLLSNSSKAGKIVDYTMSAVDYADSLIEQLKKKSQ